MKTSALRRMSSQSRAAELTDPTHHMVLIQREMDVFKEDSMTGWAECFGRENRKACTWYDFSLEMAETKQAVGIKVHISITRLIFYLKKS